MGPGLPLIPLPGDRPQHNPLPRKTQRASYAQYSHFRNYAPPLDVKGGITTEKVFPVFSESFFGLVLAWSCTFKS